MTMTIKKRRVILLVCILVFFLIVPLLLFYTLGWRWDIKLGLYKTGGLYISSSFSDSKIFVNNVLKKETNILQGGMFLQSLKPSKYSIIVSKDGFWPWKKDLIVHEQLVTEARALLVPQEPEGKIILRENYTPFDYTKYDTILEELKKLSAPLSKKATEEEVEARYSRFTTNNKEKLWWNQKENKLYIEWLGDKNSIPYYFCDNNLVCQEKIMVFNANYPIKNADFFPKRKDAVIFSIQNAVYAIEIDGRGSRTILPVYKGKNPISLINEDENAVYVLDDKNLIEIKLK